MAHFDRRWCSDGFVELAIDVSGLIWRIVGVGGGRTGGGDGEAGSW